MEYKGGYWLTNSRLVKYQSVLCENPHGQLEVIEALNPATLLEVMGEVFSSQPDLTNQPDQLMLGVEYFTDGSSFVWDGTRFAGCVVVTLASVIETHLLLVGTSARKAELVALTRVLQFLQE
jgi:hypothetical protein